MKQIKASPKNTSHVQIFRKCCHIVFRALWVAFILVFIPARLVFAELTAAQIAKQYSRSVVTIIALDENDQPLGLGSGFFINANGDVATNHHVLEGSVKALVKTVDGKKGVILEVIKDDPELDLSIAKTSLQSTNPIPLGNSDTVMIGEDIVAIGNPVGLEGTVSKGIISGVRTLDNFKFIQITAPISPGSSGGPVFNLSGRVIGIATAYLDLGQNLNFAMPINYLQSLKPTKIHLSSLSKAKIKANIEDSSLIEPTEIHYSSCSFERTTLCGVDFVLKNNSDYPVRNIKLLLVYKKVYPGDPGTFEKRHQVISYSSVIITEVILPKLALQFSHEHRVKHYARGGDQVQGMVEIRVLDYQIDGNNRSSHADLLFK